MQAGTTNIAFGLGAYSAPEAARLIGMPPATLRRWLLGYRHGGEAGPTVEPPLWSPQYDVDECELLLGFRDLVEARFVHALRRSHIGLQTIRLCLDRARDILGQDHPLSTRMFKTDGKRLFLEMTEGAAEPALVDLKARQHVFHRVVQPSLRGLEFGDERAERWWLLPDRRTIVADPRQSFGQPTIASVGLLTSRVAQEVKAEGSIERVARLYGASVAAVRDALRFERDLHARTLH